MPSQIPVHINPYDCAKRGVSFNGSISQSLFKRLLGNIVDNKSDSTFEMELNFDLDPVGGSWLTGYIRGKVILTCQRCLHDVEYDLDIALKHILCATYEHLERHKISDTIFSEEDEKVRVVDLIEDEILLDIPAIPKHQKIENCKGLDDYLTSPDEPNEIIEKASNPFAILKEKGIFNN